MVTGMQNNFLNKECKFNSISFYSNLLSHSFIMEFSILLVFFAFFFFFVSSTLCLAGFNLIYYSLFSKSSLFFSQGLGLSHCMCINVSSDHSPEPLQRAGININYGRVGKFPAMCQIFNRDMCKSLPQHFGLPTVKIRLHMCVCVCVCKK